MPRKKSEEVRHQARGNRAAGVPIGVSTDPPDPKSQEFEYLVAVHAWRDGQTANTIARTLFNDSSPIHLMQVKRALKRAHKNLVLRIVHPDADELRSKLEALVNRRGKRHVRFRVVKDVPMAGGAPVYAAAAELIAEMILEKASSDQEQVVICNAGGRTVTETVKALVRNPPVFDEFDETATKMRKSLLFVAGNAAYQAKQFHRSANFLSVTMAELFGAEHLALPKEEDEELAEEHGRLVDQAALFICGAGTCRTAEDPGLMAQYFGKKGWKLPDRAVGDIAFNLLDSTGREVALPSEAKTFMKTLNPSLSLATLMHIAKENRVMLILDAETPANKCEIGIAVLKRGYATDVVLGTRLADEIVQKWHD